MPYYDHPNPGFPSVAESTKLVRVMPLERVDAMKASNLLYVPRPWQFDDDFEGRLYQSERNAILESELRAGQAWIAGVITDMGDRLTSQHAVSCWREYQEGDEIMWSKYGGEPVNKQAIFTTVGRLKYSVPESFNFTIARVKYVSRDEYSYSGNFPDLRIFQKDEEDWAWEREVRLVVTEDVSGLIPRSPKDVPGLEIDIDFEQLVEQVIDYPST